MRVPWSAAGVALAVAMAPTPAPAASVTHAPGSAQLLFVADAGEANRVTVTSTGAALTVTDPGAGAMQTAGDCGPSGPAAVSCPAAGVTALDVSGGDGDDEIVNATVLGGRLEGDDGDDVLRGGSGADAVDGGAGDDSLDGGAGDDQVDGGGGEDYIDARSGADRLDGGAGPDVVVARDGRRHEPVACGPGQDLAIVDRGDRVARRGSGRCEQVDDGTDTTPRRGRVYVQPRRCAASGGAELGLPSMDRLVPLRYALLLRSGYRGRPAPWFDASACSVRLTATPGQGRRASATVSGGTAQLAQSSGRRVATQLSVVPPACAAAGSGRAAAKRRTARLRVSTGRQRGRWRVRGRFSIAASVGTDWTTLEGCTTTTTIVGRGRVQVHDDAKHRTVTVRAGYRYVARAR
jgi:Ca2+-binding RTX toxin-like protein